MPNWCINVLILSHPDRAQIERAVAAFQRRELLTEFFPTPEPLLDEPEPTRGAPAWYDWRVNHWGTKWDVGGPDAEVQPEFPEPRKVTLRFESAWSPPLNGVRHLCRKHGFTAQLYYVEWGMRYYGAFDSATGAEHLEDTPDTVEQARRVPPHIDEMLGITQFLREIEAIDAAPALEPEAPQPAPPTSQ